MSGIFNLIGPILRCLDPEIAHAMALRALHCGIVPACPVKHDPMLGIRLWGLDFPNPVGLAAGFDKDAEVPDAMLAQGFGFVEVGSITPRAQPGNPKPRLFRLPAERAVINRMGFNNKGAEAAKHLLALRKEKPGIVGVNLGKNKEVEDAASDYAKGIRLLAPYASYMVVNVSSPNTPGLRALQGREPLEELLGIVRRTLDEAVPENTPPLLLKIAPDLSDEDKVDIAAVVQSQGVDGVIATNTTIERPDSLQSTAKGEAGGLSGKPLFDSSTRVLGDMYKLCEGKVPIIGVGGISNAETAYKKIRAGASLVQLYSALVYEGPGLVNEIVRGLGERLRVDGFSSISEVVGIDHR
ncbi:MAG: quinone-dependent dihydroorotate dehydrogenase [Rhodospirillales bacterium]|jgi:dihydroorotate dehydrogenase|nr:quinone-dependent dihydroorotate dehydrogenase [Rhodospirillales bacterium]